MAFDLSRALQGQKALGPHASLMDNGTPITMYSPGQRRTKGLLSKRSTSRHSDAYGGSQAIDHVYDAVNLYVDAVASAEYVLKDKDGTPMVRRKTPGTPPDRKVGPSDLYDLLDKPNPFMAYDELVSLLTQDVLLVGDAYWYKHMNSDSGRPLAIYRLAPSHVQIETNERGITGYSYQPPGASKPEVMAPDDVIHFRRPNPNDPYYGIGVIQGAGRAMDLELAVTDTATHYYENRADPSLIIESERRVPRDVFRKLNAQVLARVSGPSRAGLPFVLENGLKVSSLDRTASESLFAELSLLSRDRIYAKFRTSPLLFGLMDEAGGQNKIADVRRDFDNSALRPFLTKLSKQISAALTEAWDVEFVIDHRSTLPAEEQMKVIETIAKLPGIKLREVRSLLAQFNIEESTGDPEIDEMVLNMPTPEMDANGQAVDPVTGKVVSNGKLGADQPLGSEAGRPPKGENTRAFGSTEGKTLDQIMAQLEAKALEVQSVTVGNRLPNEQRPTDTFEQARDADITSNAGMIELGLRAAAAQLERDLLDKVEGKALKTSDIVSKIKNADAWKKFRAAVAETLRDGVLRSSQSGVMYSSLTPDEDVDYDAIADEIINRPGGLNSIIKTLKERVVASVKDARAGNAERADYQAEIKTAINDWASNQASLVAETEAVHGFNEGTLVAAELSGIGMVFVTDGDDHDQPCKDADGQVWTVEEARDKRLEHPRCRRAFLPLAQVG